MASSLSKATAGTGWVSDHTGAPWHTTEPHRERCDQKYWALQDPGFRETRLPRTVISIVLSPGRSLQSGVPTTLESELKSHRVGLLWAAAVLKSGKSQATRGSPTAVMTPLLSRRWLRICGIFNTGTSNWNHFQCWTQLLRTPSHPTLKETSGLCLSPRLYTHLAHATFRDAIVKQKPVRS